MSAGTIERPPRMSWKERHQQLLDTAISLFAQKGFKGTTTKEIAEAAGVTQAVIFQHFATKEHFYTAIINDQMLQGVAEFRKTLEHVARRKNDRTVLRTLALRILNYYLNDPSYLRLVVYSALEGHELRNMFFRREAAPLYQFLADYINQRIKDGVFRRVNPLVAARAFFGMMYNHALVQVLFDDPILKIKPEKAADEFVTIFLQGLLRK